MSLIYIQFLVRTAHQYLDKQLCLKGALEFRSQVEPVFRFLVGLVFRFLEELQVLSLIHI